ncbi:MAG TPA: hypothetical protein VKG38_10200 [Solirubrobacteraceae bacterium]|nr:hypothetical protein [Solirubrobacteraceae bacterium]
MQEDKGAGEAMTAKETVQALYAALPRATGSHRRVAVGACSTTPLALYFYNVGSDVPSAVPDVANAAGDST